MPSDKFDAVKTYVMLKGNREIINNSTFKIVLMIGVNTGPTDYRQGLTVTTALSSVVSVDHETFAAFYALANGYDTVKQQIGSATIRDVVFLNSEHLRTAAMVQDFVNRADFNQNGIASTSPLVVYDFTIVDFNFTKQHGGKTYDWVCRINVKAKTQEALSAEISRFVKENPKKEG